MNRILVAAAALLAMGAIAAWGAPLATASPTDPYGDPCKLLTDGEVRSVFPDAKPGVRDRRLEQAGGDIASCVWATARGGFTVSLTPSKEPVAQEIREWSLLMVDPMGDKPGLGNKIRYEKVQGVGEGALAVMEAPAAITASSPGIAFLFARRGDYGLVLASQELPVRERSEALAALTKLGRAAMARM